MIWMIVFVGIFFNSTELQISDEIQIILWWEQTQDSKRMQMNVRECGYYREVEEHKLIEQHIYVSNIRCFHTKHKRYVN